MLTDFTALSSVRALLGVTVKELPDETLQDAIYVLTLQAEFRKISATLEADYLAAVPDVETNADAATFVGAVNLFSAYFIAKRCLAALPQFAPRSVTDGKAGFIRHTDKAFSSAATQLLEDYAVARAGLLDTYTTYLPSAALTAATTRDLFAASSPAEDVVVGG